MNTEKHISKGSDWTVVAALATLVGSLGILFYYAHGWLRVDSLDLFAGLVAVFASAGLATLVPMWGLWRRWGGRPWTLLLLGRATDSEVMAQLTAAVTRGGFRVISADATVLIGDNIAEQLDRAIKTADGIILVISAETLRSEFVQQELAQARALQKKVYPVLIEDVELPPEWAGVRLADLRHGGEDELALLVNSIRQHAQATTA